MNQRTTILMLGLTVATLVALAAAPIANDMAYARHSGSAGRGGNGGAGGAGSSSTNSGCAAVVNGVPGSCAASASAGGA
ncbi:MAG TPA: hypothetical protein VE843_01425, partial [Ktedonobacteraceae bacterium]|nr:hypothetical protein [Ktedonobacteraceae bacterium]